MAAYFDPQNQATAGGRARQAPARPYFPTIQTGSAGGMLDPRFRDAMGGSTPFRTASNPNLLYFPQGTAPAFGTPGSDGKPGGGSDAGRKLIDDYDAAHNAAKAANEARYKEINQGYADRYARGMANVEGLGNQQLADIQSGYRQDSAKALQDMTNRGLTASTVLPTMQAGYRRQANAETRRAQDEIQQRRLDLDARLSGDKLGFMERREDEYPDPNLLAKLAQLLGQGDGGNMMMPGFGGGQGQRGGGGRRYPTPVGNVRGGNIDLLLPGFGMRPGAGRAAPQHGAFNPIGGSFIDSAPAPGASLHQPMFPEGQGNMSAPVDWNEQMRQAGFTSQLVPATSTSQPAFQEGMGNLPDARTLYELRRRKLSST